MSRLNVNASVLCVLLNACAFSNAADTLSDGKRLLSYDETVARARKACRGLDEWSVGAVAAARMIPGIEMTLLVSGLSVSEDEYNGLIRADVNREFGPGGHFEKDRAALVWPQDEARRSLREGYDRDRSLAESNLEFAGRMDELRREMTIETILEKLNPKMVSVYKDLLDIKKNGVTERYQLKKEILAMFRVGDSVRNKGFFTKWRGDVREVGDGNYRVKIEYVDKRGGKYEEGKTYDFSESEMQFVTAISIKEAVRMLKQ